MDTNASTLTAADLRNMMIKHRARVQALDAPMMVKSHSVDAARHAAPARPTAPTPTVKAAPRGLTPEQTAHYGAIGELVSRKGGWGALTNPEREQLFLRSAPVARRMRQEWLDRDRR